MNKINAREKMEWKWDKINKIRNKGKNYKISEKNKNKINEIESI